MVRVVSASFAPPAPKNSTVTSIGVAFWLKSSTNVSKRRVARAGERALDALGKQPRRRGVVTPAAA